VETAEGRRTRARRAKAPEDKRPGRATLYANDEEWQLIQEAAKQKGVPLATFVRITALREARRARLKAI